MDNTNFRANSLWFFDLNTDAEALARMDFNAQGFNDSSKCEDFVKANKTAYAIVSNVWLAICQDEELPGLANHLASQISQSGLTAVIKWATGAADSLRHYSDSGFNTEIPIFSLMNVLGYGVGSIPNLIRALSFPKRFCPVLSTKLDGTAIKSFVDLQEKLRDEVINYDFFTKSGYSEIFREVTTTIFSPSKYDAVFEECSKLPCMSHGSSWLYNQNARDDLTTRNRAVKLLYISENGPNNMWINDDTQPGFLTVFEINFKIPTYFSLVGSLPANSLRSFVTQPTRNDDWDPIFDGRSYCVEQLEPTKWYFARKHVPMRYTKHVPVVSSYSFDTSNKGVTSWKTTAILEPLDDECVTWPSVSYLYKITINRGLKRSDKDSGRRIGGHPADCIKGMEVPKTAFKKRFIGISNPASMSRQLAAKKAMEKSISTYYHHTIPFGTDSYKDRYCHTTLLMPSRSQSINQELARFGTETGLYGTYDFSSASDLITELKGSLVLATSPFTSAVYQRIMRVAPSYIKIGRDIMKMITATPMGVGVCFEVEKFFYFVVGEAAVRNSLENLPRKILNEWFKKAFKASKNFPNIRQIVAGGFCTAMGDDVCLPSFAHDAFLQLCEELKLTLNMEKTFASASEYGAFRESCGKDWIRLSGTTEYVHDVTPIYWPRHEMDFSGLDKEVTEYNVEKDEWKTGTVLSSLVALQHKLVKYGHAFQWLTNTIRLLCPDMTTSLIGSNCDDLWGLVEEGPAKYLVNDTYQTPDSIHSDDIVTIDGVECNKRIGHYTLSSKSRDDIAKEARVMRDSELNAYILNQFLAHGSGKRDFGMGEWLVTILNEPMTPSDLRQDTKTYYTIKFN
jgi:hypothetical protein